MILFFLLYQYDGKSIRYYKNSSWQITAYKNADMWEARNFKACKVWCSREFYFPKLETSVDFISRKGIQGLYTFFVVEYEVLGLLSGNRNTKGFFFCLFVSDSFRGTQNISKIFPNPSLQCQSETQANPPPHVLTTILNSSVILLLFFIKQRERERKRLSEKSRIIVLLDIRMRRNVSCHSSAIHLNSKDI